MPFAESNIALLTHARVYGVFFCCTFCNAQNTVITAAMPVNKKYFTRRKVMMTKKTMTILSVFMIVALTAVGFAAWLIVGTIDAETTGSFVSNELKDKYFKVEVNFDNDGEVDEEKGDIIFMVSDGVIRSDSDALWISELININADNEPALLAGELIERARECTNMCDDASACVIKII